jgi:GDP-L-fucose synthase
MYPRECAQPMAESALYTGHPEPTSMAYAVAKLAGVQTCLAYNAQYGEGRFVPVIPNSAFGPNDDFDPATGHVLSALIARFHAARTSGAASVTLWGTGAPRREFVFADDIADACISLLTADLGAVELPLNLGSGDDFSIRELAGRIATATGYGGRILWDTTKPDGAPRKLLDSTRIRALGWRSRTSFDDALRATYDWYVKHAVTGTPA